MREYYYYHIVDWDNKHSEIRLKVNAEPEAIQRILRVKRVIRITEEQYMESPLEEYDESHKIYEV